MPWHAFVGFPFFYEFIRAPDTLYIFRPHPSFVLPSWPLKTFQFSPEKLGLHSPEKSPPV